MALRPLRFDPTLSARGDGRLAVSRPAAPPAAGVPGASTRFINPLNGTVWTYAQLIDALRGVLRPAPAPLLDSLANPANLAVSCRKLRAGYAGPCLRVRRTPDAAEQDVGFDRAGLLDAAALRGFCGSGDGFVRTWYGQVDGHASLEQANAAKQPQIVAAGVVRALGGRPAPYWQPGQDQLLSAPLNGAGQVLLGAVAASNEINGSKVHSRLLSFTASGRSTDYDAADSSGLLDTTNGSSIASVRDFTRSSQPSVPLPAGPFVASSFYDGASASVRRRGGGGASAASSGAFAAAGTLILGNDFGSEAFVGPIGEMVAMTVTSAADRDAIEASMATFFGIT